MNVCVSRWTISFALLVAASAAFALSTVPKYNYTREMLDGTWVMYSFRDSARLECNSNGTGLLAIKDSKGYTAYKLRESRAYENKRMEFSASHIGVGIDASVTVLLLGGGVEISVDYTDGTSTKFALERDFNQAAEERNLKQTVESMRVSP